MEGSPSGACGNTLEHLLRAMMTQKMVRPLTRLLLAMVAMALALPACASLSALAMLAVQGDPPAGGPLLPCGTTSRAIGSRGSLRSRWKRFEGELLEYMYVGVSPVGR